MRVARLIGAALLVFVGLSGPALAIGLYVERLDDMSVNICPVCHRVIVPGSIHENAEDVVTTEMGGALIDAGISYTRSRARRASLNVLIYRFQERRGGEFSVERPASVGFHVHFFDSERSQESVCLR